MMHLWVMVICCEWWWLIFTGVPRKTNVIFHVPGLYNPGLMHCSFVLVMRTYIRDPSRDQTGLKELYKTRTSTEWDLSFNMPADALYMTNSIIATVTTFIDQHPGQVLYCLISGIEVGTNNRSTTTKDEHHVHCALITKEFMNKEQALSVFELAQVHDHNKFKRYACPRNSNFTYMGWKLHHCKQQTKIDSTKLILFEHGTLPCDADDPDTIAKIALMRRRFEVGYIDQRTVRPRKPKDVKPRKIKSTKTFVKGSDWYWASKQSKRK